MLKFSKKLVCLICALVLALSPVVSELPGQKAEAATSSSTNVNDMTALDALGISQDEPEDYDPNAINPYGKNVVQMQTVSELFVAATSETQSTPNKQFTYAMQLGLYGKDMQLLQGDATVLSQNNWGSVTFNPKTNIYKSSEFSSDYDYSSDKAYVGHSSVSMEGNFSPDNGGKKQQVVTMTPYIYKDSTNYAPRLVNTFSIVDASDPTSSMTGVISGKESRPYSILVDNRSMYYEWSYMAMANLQVGDFDGDGFDEIAYTTDDCKISYSTPYEYVYLHVLKLQDQSADGWKNPANWQEVFSMQIGEENLSSIYDSSSTFYLYNYVTSVTAGDFNRDGVDDLAVSCRGYNNYTEPDGIKFLWGARAGDMLKSKSTLELNHASNDSVVFQTNVALGDVDGDGTDELVVAGNVNDYTDDTSVSYSYYVAMYKWNGTDFSMLSEKTFHLFEKDKNGNYVNDVVNGRSVNQFYAYDTGKVNLAAGSFNGAQEPDAIYLDSMLISYTDNDLKITGLYDKLISKSSADYLEFNVRAADFDGDGKEVPVLQVMYMTGHKAREVSFWSSYDRTMSSNLLDVVALVDNTAGSGSVVAKKYTTTNKKYSYALPDVDNDTTYMTYKNVHYFQYSDPEILAVLASPPYFKDLENPAFDGPGNSNSTRYSKIEGSGEGSSYGNTFHIGAYLSYSHDIEVFGVKVAQVEFETEVQNKFTWESETISSKEFEASYETLSGQDTVVFFSVPMEVFAYDIAVPVYDEDGNFKEMHTETMEINIPHTPCVKTISLEKYERIAKDFNELPQIADEILTHTVGMPDTYPKSASELESKATILPNMTVDFPVFVAPATNKAAPATDYGKGSQTHSLTMTSETTDSFTYELSLDFKAGAGIGDYTAGIATGYAHTAGSCTVTTTGSAFSGTIYDLPHEAEEAGYGFNWRVATFSYSDGKITFPVVTYLVNDVTQGPLLPTQFKQNEDHTTTKQVALNWDYTGNPAGFIISKYYKSAGNSGFYQIAYVGSGDTDHILNTDGTTRTYEYIDTGLDADTEYQYQITTVSNSYNVKSVPSETLVCYTLPSGKVPDLRVTTEELTAYPDTPTVVDTYLNNEDDLKSCTLTYQWQKYDEKEKAWKNLKRQTDTTLTIENAGLDDEGKYRCVVYCRSGSYLTTSRSPEVQVNYSKRTVVLDQFKVDHATGETTLKLSSADSNSVPSGVVFFYVTGAGVTETYMGLLDAQGTATAKLDLKNGTYRITADYAGSRVFSAEHFTHYNDVPVFYTVGQTQASVVYDYAETYTYGDQLNILQYTLDSKGNITSMKEVDYSQATFGLQGSNIVFQSDASLNDGYSASYAHYKLNDYRDFTFEDGSQVPDEIIYKFTDPAVIYPSGHTGAGQIIENRFKKGYAAYAGRPVFMKYEGQLIELNIEPKKISVELDMSDVPEVVNAGDEAHQYYSEDAMLSYMTSEDLALFGEEKNDSEMDYIRAGYVSSWYAGHTYYKVTARARIDKESQGDGIDLDAPSMGTYVIRREFESSYFSRNYMTSDVVPTTAKYNNMGLDNELKGYMMLKNTDGATKKYYLYKTFASIADCYEWDTIKQQVVIAGNDLNKCTVSAATVSGIPAGTVEEVSPAVHNYYPVGTTVVFQATPYDGFEVDYWTLNGEVVEEEASNTLMTIQTKKGTEAVVYFKRKANKFTYTVTPKSPKVNGTAVTNKITFTPSVKSGGVIAFGSEITAKATPAKGWHLKEWEYQPEKQKAQFVTGNEYTFEMPNANVRLYANFERDSYKLTLAAGVAAYDADGKEIRSGSMVVGDSKVTIKKAPGYEFKTSTPEFTTSVTTTDLDTNSKTYTFTMLANTKVSANTKKGSYTVKLADSAYGEIKVTDALGKTVDLRNKQTGASKLYLTAIPDSGYAVSKWNGVANTANSIVYTVSGNETITVDFKEKAYKKVTIGNMANGTYRFTSDLQNMITTKNILKVYKGETMTVRATPDKGYTVAGWFIYRTNDKDAKNPIKSYVSTSSRTRTLEYTDDIEKIEARMIPVSLVKVESSVVKVSGATHGSMKFYTNGQALGTTGYVGDGEDVTCYAYPAEGYRVKTWKVDGTAQSTTGNVLKLTKVQKDTKVTVEYTADGSSSGYSAMVAASEGGSVYVNTDNGLNTSKIPEGTKVTLVTDPWECHKFSKVTVTYVKSGTKQTVTVDSNQSFPMPAANVTITPVWSEVMQHQHTLVIDAKKKPTCTQTGLTKGSHCSSCNTVINAQQKIAKLGHIYEEQFKAATMTANGSRSTVCTVCKAVKSGTLVTYYKASTVKLSKTSMTYTGKALKPSVVVKDSKGKAIPTTNYTVKYANNTKVGTATVTVTFKNNYSGSKKLTFKIVK